MARISSGDSVADVGAGASELESPAHASQLRFCVGCLAAASAAAFFSSWRTSCSAIHRRKRRCLRENCVSCARRATFPALPRASSPAVLASSTDLPLRRAARSATTTPLNASMYDRKRFGPLGLAAAAPPAGFGAVAAAWGSGAAAADPAAASSSPWLSSAAGAEASEAMAMAHCPK